MARSGSATLTANLAFVLFLLATGSLFIRPAELFTPQSHFPFYLLFITPCLVLSIFPVLEQLRASSLVASPITACIVGLTVAVPLSELCNFHLSDAFASGTEFSKIALFYLLFVAILNSISRLHIFLVCFALTTFILVCLGLLQYHDVIEVPALTNLTEGFESTYDPVTGGTTVLKRLCSAGIFNNPNDLSRIIVVAMVLCLYWFTDRPLGMVRYVWLAPLAVLVYALVLTHSRGGFLGFLAGVLVLLHARLGTKKTIILAIVVIPLLLAVQDRQTAFSVAEGTGQQRILLWRDGFQSLRSNPIIGIGMNNYATEIGNGLYAHNSFVQCYVELGLFGGICFVGAWFLASFIPFRLQQYGQRDFDPDLRRFGPYLLAIAVSYTVGMFSSTRSYDPPTYALLGIAAAYGHLASAHVPLPVLWGRKRLLPRLVLVGVVTLVGHDVFIRLFAT